MIDPFLIPKTTTCKSFKPTKDQFIARGTIVIGDIRLDEQVSIWYQAVLRADINYIKIQKRSNIQDGCVIHVTNNHPCIIENDVTVAHHATLHGCHIKQGTLIGIGAIVLTGASIGKGSIIAAGCVIKENQVIPPFSLVVGVPGKIIKTLDEKAYQENCHWAKKYVQLAKIHQKAQN